MVIQALLRFRNILRLDSIDDRRMIPPGRYGVDIVQIYEVRRLVEGEPEHIDKPRKRIVVLATEEQGMKKLVFVGEGLATLCVQAHPVHRGTQLGNILVADHLQRLADQADFQRAADLDDFLDLAKRASETISEIVEQRLERERLDENTDAAAGLQDAEGFQRLDAFAQRIAADAQLACELGFCRKQRTRFQPVVADIGAQAFLHGDVQKGRAGQGLYGLQRHANLVSVCNWDIDDISTCRISVNWISSHQTWSSMMSKQNSVQGLIVSCQPVPGGPMDNAAFVVGFAQAALVSGARALRIESVAYVAAVRAVTDVPIIGLVKRDLAESPVRITPFVADAEALIDAGADIIAFDATERPRPATVGELVHAVKARGRLTMADCSCLADARRALAAGVDFVGTTLSGYIDGPEPEEPDLALIAAIRQLTPHVIAEGRIRSPQQAAAAVKAGAFAVVVGSAITRTEHVTSWFSDAVSEALRRATSEPVLAIDIGGTKMMAALVSGSEILAEMTVPTDRDADPDAWLSTIAKNVAAWAGRYRRIGIAATGLIRDGRWSALNPATLGIPDGYLLVEKAEQLFGVPVHAVNDAQAAAWGEYRFGAGQGANMVFLTISTGIGGGIVFDGRLLTGMAGHFGLIRGPAQGVHSLEDQTSGRWMAAEAAKAGHAVDAAEVFARWRKGDVWATKIVSHSAQRVATLCADIQMMLDPKMIVIGGGIGLADGYLDEVRKRLPPRSGATITSAKLGARAGAIGVADIATAWPRKQ